LRGAVLISLLLLALPTQAAELIGTQVPPYPAGLNSLGGSCIGDPLQGEDVCAWSIGALGNAPGAAIAVYAARLTGRDSDGTPRWLVTGHLSLPTLAEGYDVQIATCRLDGVADSQIVAVARFPTEAEYSSDVSWAAIFERKGGTLREIGTKGIDCLLLGE
jgi:hypothetical protein